MNKPLLISLSVASLLLSNASAESMYDRFQSMEKEMKRLQYDMDALKKEQSVSESESDDAIEAVSHEEDKADTDDEEGDDEADAEDEESDNDADMDEEEDDEESNASTDEKIATLEETIADLEEDIEDLNSRTNGNALKLGVDFRSSIENLSYKMADGKTISNDALLINRLWINMNWKATDNLSFTGQLAYNKAFGARSGFGGGYPGFETFDWITNENAYDDVVRVRSAYFLYRNDTFLGSEIPWTFSIGRRPSTNGHLINLRDDDHAASPMGHTINVEFDGMSAKFGLEEVLGVDGMYVKFCAGRGGTNANAKFFTIDPDQHTPSISAPYAAGETEHGNVPDIDLAGLIFIPYDDGQYKLATQYYYANNLIDANFDPTSGAFLGMKSVGGMHSFTANFKIDGIGDEINDFLDETTLFLSAAWSKTDPNDSGGGMLGSKESETGSSYWIGAQFPSLLSEEGRWGLEYNHGDKYWRSITYAEDTNIGSKVAARGNAYEAYFTEPLIDDVLSLQLRYTYIDYDYTGSNGFFGNATGTPTKISDLEGTPYASMSVDTAQDIRLYIRYRY